MKAKPLSICALLCAVLLTSAGCAASGSSASAPEPAPDAASADTTIRLGGKILDAVKADSYKDFAAALAGRTGFDVAKKDFESSCGSVRTKYGKLISAAYLTELETPLVRNQIWKVRFEKKLTDGKTQTQDMLFRLVTGNTDGGTKVLAFGFF